MNNSEIEYYINQSSFTYFDNFPDPSNSLPDDVYDISKKL